MVSFILLIVGGLNWLLFGLFGWEVGSLLGGWDSWVSRAVYILVGLAAVFELVDHKRSCKVCVSSAPGEKAQQDGSAM